MFRATISVDKEFTVWDDNFLVLVSNCDFQELRKEVQDTLDLNWSHFVDTDDSTLPEVGLAYKAMMKSFIKPDIKVVTEIYPLPPGAKYLKEVLVGSGNPEEDHDIVGVAILDENKNRLYSFGNI